MAFILKTLNYFSFTPNFVKWIKCMHYNVESCVMNNVQETPFSRIKSGVNQGCP